MGLLEDDDDFGIGYLHPFKWLLMASMLVLFSSPFLAPVPPLDCQAKGEKPLHLCAMGFAANQGVYGGHYSPKYVVISDEDELENTRQGSLRWAVANMKEGVHITFNRSMHIRLKERLFLSSRTTIDGRGFFVKLSGGGFVIENVTQVIIHNIEVGHQPGDHDVIPIRGSNVVWIDHCYVHDGKRGTIDVVYNSTDVTISNNLIHNHRLTMLLGAADEDEYDVNMRVTVYRNWFKSSGQRQPHCRWGMCHVANNLFTDWAFYCLGGRAYARIRSDNNVFHAGSKRKEVTPWFGEKSLSTPGFDYSSTIKSFGDLLLNGATFHEFDGVKGIFTPPYHLEYFTPSNTMEQYLRQSAGPRYPFRFSDWRL